MSRRQRLFSIKRPRKPHPAASTYPRPQRHALFLSRPGHRDGCETVSRLWSVSGDASSNGRARGAWMRTPAVRPLTAAGPREASRQRAGCDYPRPADRNPAAQCGASRRLYSHCGRPRHRRAPHPTHSNALAVSGRRAAGVCRLDVCPLNSMAGLDPAIQPLDAPRVDGRVEPGHNAS